jgi:fructose 1,6-bisphosphatase
MDITLSVIKADMGSIGGRIAPSREVFETVKARVASLEPRFRVRGK